MTCTRACLLLSLCIAFQSSRAFAGRQAASYQHSWIPRGLTLTWKARHNQTRSSILAAEPNSPGKLHAYDGIIIWCWAGIYHQCKELHRVLQTEGQYNVTLQYRGDFPPSDPADDSALHIFVPATEAKALPPHYILYQTEQTTHSMLNHSNAVWPMGCTNTRKQTVRPAFEGAVEVWEYSQRQINLFRESEKDGARAVRFRHVPFSWFPVVPIVGEEEKDIAILHYGAVDAGNRRKVILDTLKHRGIDIHVAPYNVWGAKLTLLIRRAKIVLNLHYHEARTLETCRIMESTSLGALVISEPGMDQELKREWDDKIVFAEGVDAIEQALRQYSGDDEARCRRHQAAWKHAQLHYALPKYLGDVLQSSGQ